MKRFGRRYTLRARFLMLLVVAALAWPAGVAVAAPAAQATPDTIPLGLGEYAFVEMASDESLAYEVVISEAGAYLITPADADAAYDFDLIVTDDAGNELYNDIFGTVELALEPGSITLDLYSVADQTLGLVVLGQIGVMSSDEGQPGHLFPGSIYTEEDVSDARYGTVTVPETPYPQQVLVYIEGSEEDTFFATMDGGSGYDSLTTDSENLLSFWTHGGEVNIYLDPYDRGAGFTLIVFLGGEPAKLSLDEPLEGRIPAGARETVVGLELDANYTDLSLTAEGDEFVDLTLVDRYYDGTINWGTYGDDELLIDSLYAGVYYVFVQTDEEAAADIPFTLTATGVAGRPIVRLEDGVPYEDAFAEGEDSITYVFDVTTPGSLVSMEMAGDDDETDFDMYAGMRPGDSTYSSYTYGSDESLGFMASVAGPYYLTVVSYDEVGAFTLTASEGDLAPALNSGEVVYGEYVAGGSAVYRLEAETPGAMLSVALVGSQDIDLDLSVTAYDARGYSLLSLGGYSGGSVEMVSTVLPAAGLYAVVVNASYTTEDGAFFIQARLDDPRYFGGQWATDALASSQFGDPGYSAVQATGPSDTPYPADVETAWAAAEADAGEETLELIYDYTVAPTGVAVVESFNPGAVVMVEAFDIETGEWVVLYEGEAAPSDEPYRVFRPPLAEADFRTDSIRLTLDTAAVPGFNEIDAVQLFGRP